MAGERKKQKRQKGTSPTKGKNSKQPTVPAWTLLDTDNKITQHLKSLERFERLCCLGDEALCQSLGQKHHKTNSKCWMHPKICYHCDLRTLGHEIEPWSREISQAQQCSELSQLPVRENIPKLAAQINEESFRRNGEVHSQFTRKIQQSECCSRTLPSTESVSNGESDQPSMLKSDGNKKFRGSRIPSWHVEIANSIETPMPGVVDLTYYQKEHSLYQKDASSSRGQRRSRALSPEIHQHRSIRFDPGLVHGEWEGKREISRAPSAGIRDIRHELSFLLNAVR